MTKIKALQVISINKAIWIIDNYIDIVDMSSILFTSEPLRPALVKLKIKHFILHFLII